MRALIIVLVCCVLGFTGWLIFNQSDPTQEGELPMPARIVHATEQESGAASKQTSETPLNQSPQSPKTIRPVVEKTTTTEADESEGMASKNEAEPEPQNTSGMSPEEIQRTIENALSFPATFTDIEETAAQLEEALTAKYGGHPKIPRFVDLWEQVHHVVRVAEAQENEANVSSILNLLPAVVTSEWVETFIDIANLNAEEAAEGRAMVAELTETIDRVELVEMAKPLVEDAVSDGTMTAEEAKAFIKELTGFDSEIEILPAE